MAEKHNYVSLSQTNLDDSLPIPQSNSQLLCRGPLYNSYGSPSPCPAGANPFMWHRRDRKQARLNSQLLKSIQNGDLDAVIKFLDLGANANATCRITRCSASNLAVLLGFNEILTELLNRDACIDLEDIHGQNILHYVAYAQNVECLQTIIKYAESVDSKYNIIGTIVNKTAQRRDICPLLRCFSDNMEHNCNSLKRLVPKLTEGCTPLHVAAQNANLSITKILIENGADLTIPDSRDCLPMNVIGEVFLDTGYENVEHEIDSFLETIKYFISKNAPFVDSVCSTPLHIAIELKHLESVNLLLKCGANPDSLNMMGETSYHLAIHERDAEILRVLIEHRLRQHEDMSIVNVSGYTPFQAAVESQWIEGIFMLLEAGADVTEMTHSGDTALHLAASTGNIDLVEELLEIEQTSLVINSQNNNAETPLLCAIKSGNCDCVRALVKAGSNVRVELPGGLTILHRVAEYGYSDILQEIIEAAKQEDYKNWLNQRDTLPLCGLTPLHMAAFRNKYDCVQILLEAGCDSNVRSTSHPHKNALPLHMAAFAGHHDVVELLLDHDREAVHAYNLNGWNALHIAASQGYRKSVQILLNHGADLSISAYDPHRNRSETAANMIMHNVSRPTEFMEEIFDKCLTMNEYCVNDPLCTVNVTYDILTPRTNTSEEMIVMKAIMNTGNRFGQKRLLLHPVIESFLYLKWKGLCPFFYTILALYILYVLSLTIVGTSYYYLEPLQPHTAYIINRQIWSWILIISLVAIVSQEVLHAKQYLAKYIFELETWIKWSSFILSTFVALLDQFDENADWLRHTAAVAILLAWIELMFLFSRFPDWGYYVLMFFKVSKNVVKVLLTFGFLVIGFSLSFLLEFRANPPFGSPWEAIVKTIVMMTSEFDYVDLFDKPDDSTWAPSLLIGRVVFVVFLVLASIVLMNLMVGLAVSDISVLEIQGKMQRLEKQVDFLGALDALVRMKSNERTRKMENCENAPLLGNNVVIFPGQPRRHNDRKLPMELTDHLIDRAALQKESELTLTTSDVHNQIEQFEKNTLERLDKLIEQNIQPNSQSNKFIDKDDLSCTLLKDILRRVKIIENNIAVQPNQSESMILPQLHNIDTQLQNILSVLQKT